jgi:3-isopropylmalate dehydrogenase
VSLLLEHFGYTEAAARVNDAVAADLSERGTAVRRTSDIGDAIVARLA